MFTKSRIPAGRCPACLAFGKIDTQGQHIDEEPDHTFDLEPVAIRHRESHHQVVLACIAGKQSLEGAQQEHEERRRLASAELGEPLRHLLRHPERPPRSSVARHHRPAAICRQLQDRKHAGEPLLPVSEPGR